MSVLLRCPKCGTTQDSPGECVACYEGEVRYYCDNHVPGLWLDGPVCTTCGARFGIASEPPPRSRPAAPRPPAASRSPRRTRPTAEPRPSAPRPRADSADEPPRADPDPSPAPTPPPSLAGLLAHLIAARRARERARLDPLGGYEEIAAPPPRPKRGGCLFTLLLIAAMLIGLVTCGPSLIFSVLNYGF